MIQKVASESQVRISKWRIEVQWNPNIEESEILRIYKSSPNSLIKREILINRGRPEQNS